MIRMSHTNFSAALRGTFAAAALTLTSIPAAFAGDYKPVLQNFLAQPSSFVVMSESSSGPVTATSLKGDTLAIQFVIPTHVGETFGQYVGTMEAEGVFVGESLLTPEFGDPRSANVSLVFQDDGTILAAIEGHPTPAAFVPNEMHVGF